MESVHKIKIKFEPGPAADVTGAIVTVAPQGIRIKSSDGQTRYYFGVGALTAQRVTINMGSLPELQGKKAPKPSAELVKRFGASPCHIGVLAVGVLAVGVSSALDRGGGCGGGVAPCHGAAGAGAIGTVCINFGTST